MDVNIVPSFYTKGAIEVCEKSMTDYAAYNSISNDPVSCDWEVINESGAWSFGQWSEWM